MHKKLQERLSSGQIHDYQQQRQEDTGPDQQVQIYYQSRLDHRIVPLGIVWIRWSRTNLEVLPRSISFCAWRSYRSLPRLVRIDVGGGAILRNANGLSLFERIHGKSETKERRRHEGLGGDSQHDDRKAEVICILIRISFYFIMRFKTFEINSYLFLYKHNNKVAVRKCGSIVCEAS